MTTSYKKFKKKALKDANVRALYNALGVQVFKI